MKLSKVIDIVYGIVLLTLIKNHIFKLVRRRDNGRKTK